MRRSILKFLNSPIGILLLTSCVVGPAGFFISEYRNSLAETKRLEQEALARETEVAAAKTRRTNLRRRVKAHCEELSERNVEIRKVRDHWLFKLDRQRVSDVVDLFVQIPAVPPDESDVHHKDAQFQRVSFSVLVNRLEDLTAGDEELRLIGQRIRREHDAAYNALRSNDELEAARQLTLQNQDLIDCKTMPVE